MRWLGRAFLIVAAAAALTLAPAAAIAATPSAYSDPISGFEYAAAATQGSFVGAALGAVPGAWSATVDHTPLGASATITGGEFSLVTYQDGALTTLTGDFTAGTVQQLSGFTGCVNQRYAVNGLLGNVGFGTGGSGTGTFAATLTHYRTKIFGSCLTYSASISGSLSLAPA
jgi:hypothetical protein